MPNEVKLLPCEPTPEMIAAAKATVSGFPRDSAIAAIWQAMWDAARPTMVVERVAREELHDEIVRIIETSVCEVGAEGLENGEILGADTAADQILALSRIAEALTEKPPPENELVERVADAIGRELPNLANGTAIHLRLARAAIAAMPAIVGGEGRGWQPIETAPSDRMFLAAIHHGKAYVVCQARRTIAGVFDTMEDSCVGWRPHPAYKPAYWQPLPEPPEPNP